VGGLVDELAGFELLEHAASETAASAAAIATFPVIERIETSLGRVPRTPYTEADREGFNG
jgi:hypothetical protein